MCDDLDSNFENPKISGKEVKIVIKINRLGFFSVNNRERFLYKRRSTFLDVNHRDQNI